MQIFSDVGNGAEMEAVDNVISKQQTINLVEEIKQQMSKAVENVIHEQI